MQDSNNRLSERVRGKLKEPIIILTIITSIIASFLAAVQISIGVHYFDVFTDLNVALNYAGVMGETVNVLSRSPLIPYLTSFVFQAGIISSSVIIIIDAIIFVFGVIGLYLLLKLRFNEIQSFVGCLIYISLPLVFSWAASGSIDVPGVSFSIWTVYLLVISLEKNSKYLYLVLPMFIIALLTRYTTALLIFPMILYLILDTEILKKLKKPLTHIIIGLGVATPVIIYYLSQKFSYLSQLVWLILIPVSAGKDFGVGDAGYNPDNLFYLHNLLNYIAVGPLQENYSKILSPSLGSPSYLSYIIVVLVLCGLGLYIYRIFKEKIRQTRQLGKNKFNNESSKMWNIIIVIILLILIIAGFLSFFYASYIITDIIVFFICLLIYKLLKEVKISNLKMDILFLSWFLTFFIMHSVTPVKVDRYLITITPALAYFITLGLSVLIEKYKYKIKNKNLKTWGLYLIVGIIFLSSTTATFIGHTPKTCLIKYVEPPCQWLTEYDPQYQDKIIFSDYSPAVSWSMRKVVRNIEMKNFKSPEEFASALMNDGAEYYIDVYSQPKPTLPGYHEIKKTSSITIYQRNS